VDVLEGESWVREKEHERRGMDVFRMSGPEAFRVRLRLSMKAKNLLVEEYPLAERDLSPDGDAWILDTGICAVAGVGRFVSGLANEVEILDGEPLRAYLREYAENFLKNF
ncbi:MAG: WYL domain-containing protein, partial [Bacteroidales bacterium]|nr:WYL domain-containing protein [Bacteroidales bacterium]